MQFFGVTRFSNFILSRYFPFLSYFQAFRTKAMKEQKAPPLKFEFGKSIADPIFA
jgi:hypothetical protein